MLRIHACGYMHDDMLRARAHAESVLEACRQSGAPADWSCPTPSQPPQWLFDRVCGEMARKRLCHSRPEYTSLLRANTQQLSTEQREASAWPKLAQLTTLRLLLSASILQDVLLSMSRAAALTSLAACTSHGCFDKCVTAVRHLTGLRSWTLSCAASAGNNQHWLDVRQSLRELLGG